MPSSTLLDSPLGTSRQFDRLPDRDIKSLISQRARAAILDPFSSPGPLSPSSPSPSNYTRTTHRYRQPQSPRHVLFESPHVRSRSRTNTTTTSGHHDYEPLPLRRESIDSCSAYSASVYVQSPRPGLLAGPTPSHVRPTSSVLPTPKSDASWDELDKDELEVLKLGGTLRHIEGAPWDEAGLDDGSRGQEGTGSDVESAGGRSSTETSSSVLRGRTRTASTATATFFRGLGMSFGTGAGGGKKERPGEVDEAAQSWAALSLERDGSMGKKSSWDRAGGNEPSGALGDDLVKVGAGRKSPSFGRGKKGASNELSPAPSRAPSTHSTFSASTLVTHLAPESSPSANFQQDSSSNRPAQPIEPEESLLPAEPTARESLPSSSNPRPSTYHEAKSYLTPASPVPPPVPPRRARAMTTTAPPPPSLTSAGPPPPLPSPTLPALGPLSPSPHDSTNASRSLSVRSKSSNRSNGKSSAASPSPSTLPSAPLFDVSNPNHKDLHRPLGSPPVNLPTPQTTPVQPPQQHVPRAKKSVGEELRKIFTSSRARSDPPPSLERSSKGAALPTPPSTVIKSSSASSSDAGRRIPRSLELPISPSQHRPSLPKDFVAQIPALSLPSVRPMSSSFSSDLPKDYLSSSMQAPSSDTDRIDPLHPSISTVTHTSDHSLSAARFTSPSPSTTTSLSSTSSLTADPRSSDPASLSHSNSTGSASSSSTLSSPSDAVEQERIIRDLRAQLSNERKLHDLQANEYIVRPFDPFFRPSFGRSFII
jgi:hypothetical protein